MFIGNEVMYYLGQYTLVSYDQQEQPYGVLWWRSFGRTSGLWDFLCERSEPSLYDVLRKNLVTLATAATGMSHHISSVFITTLTLRGQIMEKQGGFRWKLNAVLPWLVGDGCHTKCCYYLFDFSLWKFSSILKIEISISKAHLLDLVIVSVLPYLLRWHRL